MKTKKIIALLVLLAAIGTMGFAGSQLAKAQRIYREGSTAYDDLRGKAKQPQAPQPPPAQKPQIDIPRLGIDFGALRTVSKDTAAWLYSPGTVIDYPVMRANDYDYYLHHLPGGAQNANGSLFIDYNNAPDFSGPLTVIYGHHMRSGMMFGSLKGYKTQAYYDEHPFMYLYTPGGDYRLELLYGCVIAMGQWRDRAFMYPENLSSLLAYAARNTTFKSSVSYAPGDRIVAMSTCSYEFDNARYVVIGILRPTESEDQ